VRSEDKTFREKKQGFKRPRVGSVRQEWSTQGRVIQKTKKGEMEKEGYPSAREKKGGGGVKKAGGEQKNGKGRSGVMENAAEGR